MADIIEKAEDVIEEVEEVESDPTDLKKWLRLIIEIALLVSMIIGYCS